MESLKIVPVPEIPIAQDVDLTNLFKIYKTCLQLRDLCEKENGIGISAVQAGIPLKLFLVKNLHDSHYGYYANCEYLPVGDKKILHLEGCLSIKTSKNKLRTFEVERAHDILINGYQIIEDDFDLELKEIKDYSVPGFYAAVFAHEIDHQNGILISDIGKEVDLTPITG